MIFRWAKKLLPQNSICSIKNYGPTTRSRNEGKFIHSTPITSFRYGRKPKPAAECEQKKSKVNIIQPTCQEDIIPAKRKVVPTCEADVTKTCDCDACVINPDAPQPRIVIIGAGMAGLSAAQKLIASGLKNVIICEAKHRPGGRIHSCKFGGTIAELGAEWIEGGCIANPIYNLAGVQGLLQQPLSRKKASWGVCLSSDGRAILSFKKAQSIIKRVLSEAASLFSRSEPSGYADLGKFIQERIQAEVAKFCDEDQDEANQVLTGMANKLRTRWGEDLTQLSADQFGSFVEIPGGHIHLPSGVGSLMRLLLKEVGSCNIKFCKMVQSIQWGVFVGSACRALVKCCDGEEIPADYVIVTVSLGVLKSQADKLFCPQLPNAKIDAIVKLGYGHVNKIFLLYQDAFWIPGEGSVNLGWTENELLDRSDWIKGIGSIEEVEGSERVLEATVGGKEAVHMESCSDKQVAEELTMFLRKITGDPTLPCPTKMLRSKWSTDLNFLGASSYMGLSSSVEHQCELAAPLPGVDDPTPPIVLFAGEATAPGFFSTLQGARISGLREADRIIALTREHCGPPANPIP